MPITDYFSADYGEARAKFLDACGAAGARVESFENPNAGPDGAQLYTDVAELGPRDAEAVLALGSGTHGVEGFCGSGIQTGLLRDGLASQLKPGQSVVMIHAINPFGFAHLRRFNEDNIDPNRNFIDHTAPHPPSPAYDALYDAINPQVGSRWKREASFLRLLMERAIKGTRTLKVAITEGQYMHPTGLFFGGTFETWSNQTLRSISDRYFSGANRVAFVDIHTGLGPFGQGELFCRFPVESAAFKRMTSWWGDRVTPAMNSNAAADSLTGTTVVAVSDMLPEAEVSSVTLEFGTFGPIAVLRALQAENWLHHHGGVDNPRAQAIKAEIRRVFYPDTDDWKTRVWNQGREIVDQALAGLRQPP